MQPLRHRVERRLQRGTHCADAQTAATCRALLKLAPALWTFIDVPGVEPTNNAAERALRQAVLWRKRSFGAHSAAGSRFAERMLTVATTLKQQGRNVVDYVTRGLHRVGARWVSSFPIAYSAVRRLNAYSGASSAPG